MKNITKRKSLPARVGEGLLELLYPSKCPFCGRICRDGICAACRQSVPYLAQPRCMKCGKPVGELEEYCHDCRRIHHAFEEGRSLWLHKSPVSDAVYAMKYKNLRIYGKVFGEELAAHYGGYLHRHGVELLVPIPLHRKRLRQRGYNQSQLVAETLGELTGIPVETDLLVRAKETKAQKNLNDKQRRINMKGAFKTIKFTEAKRVALIDDIYTTGSTLDEAASALKRAGAEKVYFLTISIGQGI